MKVESPFPRTILLAIMLTGIWYSLRSALMESNQHRKSVLTEFSSKDSLAPLPASDHRFIIISHRGDHVVAPENSLQALDSALAHGVDYVEIDLRTSQDSVLYIMHDESVNRTTTGKGLLRRMSAFDLDTCHLRNSRETIPRLSKYLEKCGRRTNIYLDFKDADVRQTLKMLDEYRMRNHILVYINSYTQYAEWRKWSPETPVILSLPGHIKDSLGMKAFLDKYPAEVLDGGHDEYEPAMVEYAESKGIRVWPDIQGSNEEKDWETAIRKGFTGLQTDHPENLARWLHDKGLR